MTTTAQASERTQGAMSTASGMESGWQTKCLNCGAQLSGAFCSECGQRAVPSHPTVRELASDAVAELSGWDGRLARTVRLLILRPGQLTLGSH